MQRQSKTMKRLMNIFNESHETFNISLINNDITKWVLPLETPTDSPYRGSIVQVFFTFDPNGILPPIIRYSPILYHPNINPVTGLQENTKSFWDSSLVIDDILVSLRCL